MNVTNVSAGRWRIESESTPNKYYEVLYQSDAAKKQGVQYSCDCASWVNNQYNRSCKHIKEIETLIQNKVMSMTNKIQTVPVQNYPNMGSARKRGRPSRDDTKRCPICHKLTVRMKEEGICGNPNCRSIPYKRGRTRRRYITSPNTGEVKMARPIDEDTVQISTEAIEDIANRLELN
jgi:hypothetical protein